tara:strand:+ start:667 stop:795 length:129 start_codon:yes stop_codon:yes gene_type:complete
VVNGLSVDPDLAYGARLILSLGDYARLDEVTTLRLFGRLGRK